MVRETVESASSCFEYDMDALFLTNLPPLPLYAGAREFQIQVDGSLLDPGEIHRPGSEIRGHQHKAARGANWLRRGHPCHTQNNLRRSPPSPGPSPPTSI